MGYKLRAEGPVYGDNIVTQDSSPTSSPLFPVFSRSHFSSSQCRRQPHEWLLYISGIAIIVLSAVAFWADTLNGHEGVYVGGWYTTYAIFPELLLIPFWFMLGITVRKYSTRWAILCFAFSLSMLPIMILEVTILQWRLP